MPSRRIDLDELQHVLRERAVGGRLIVALAGPPGSGKSTLSELLVDGLNADVPGWAAVLPMDGFHYDDLYLTPPGLRPRKGAPDTFDVGGLEHALQRLRSGDADHVAVPIFDRQLEIARAGARLIPKETRIIVVEGNYLLLRTEPWSGLSRLFDVTVLIETPDDVLAWAAVSKIAGLQSYARPDCREARRQRSQERAAGDLAERRSGLSYYQRVTVR